MDEYQDMAAESAARNQEFAQSQIERRLRSTGLSHIQVWDLLVLAGWLSPAERDEASRLACKDADERLKEAAR